MTPVVARTSQTQNLGGVTQVSAGGDTTCALDGSAMTYCWGADSLYQTGQPAAAAQPLATQAYGSGSYSGFGLPLSVSVYNSDTGQRATTTITLNQP